jgi:hypothetical protein
LFYDTHMCHRSSMRHFFKGDLLSCALKIILKVSNLRYIESHRIPIKSGADIAIHIRG